MTNTKRHPAPSLFETESRGGDTAEGGFSFQEQYVLSRVPIWLAHNGFAMMIREAMGDAEAKFFVPGYGFQIELIEAKNHSLTPSQFWAEIERFQEIDRGSPGEYRWFTLASAGISDALGPLVNGLRRIRLPYGFYEHDSAIAENSFKDYLAIVRKLGRSTRDAEFLFEKVLIDSDMPLAKNHGEALFRQSIAENLPEFENASLRLLHAMYVNAGEYIKGRGIEPVTRKELESIVYDSFSADQKPPMSPVHIHTMNRKVDQDYPFSLRFDWAEFFGGDKREYPRTSSWNEQLLKDLVQTRDWILENRNSRQIRLTGSRRLSAMFAIGNVFSAVAGFSVTMNHRGQSWSTSDYPTATTPSYPVKANLKHGAGASIIVSIGILRDIAEDVERALIALDLDRSSILHIESTEEVASPEQANLAVREIKDVISNHLSGQEFKQAHMFYAGPSHLALFLAHRLNATVPIQCYEWVPTNTYLPACSLY